MRDVRVLHIGLSNNVGGIETVVHSWLKYKPEWLHFDFIQIGEDPIAFEQDFIGTFMATSYTVHKDSFGYLFSSTFGAALNIILNLALIPLWGVYGAAFATCVSYIAVFAFRIIHTRKYIRYKVFTKEFVIGSIIMLISSVLMYADSIYGLLIQVLLLIVFALVGTKIWLPYINDIMKRIKKRGV